MEENAFKPRELSEEERLELNENDDDESVLIANTNKILTSVGIAFKQIISMEELARVAPSMFVAVVESLYKMKIDGIIRNPQTKSDYIQNAQLMINSLSDQLKVDLSYITGEMIVLGNKEALSNLVNIFMRLLSLTGTNESLQSLGSNEEKDDEEEFHRRFSYPSADSISTKDSLLLPKHSSSLPRQKTAAQKGDGYFLRQKTAQTKTHSERKFIDSFLNESMRKTEKLLHSNSKQLQAERRRKMKMQFEQNMSRARNEAATRRSKKALHKKWIIDKQSERKSFEMKSGNEEVVALHNIYKNLFREVVRQRAEEKKEEHVRVQILKKRLETEVETLDKLYREKLYVIEKQEDYQKAFEKNVYENILSELSSKLHSNLERQQNLLKQNREKEFRWKQEACQQLLLSIHGSKWEDFLRIYPEKHRSRQTRHSN